MIETGYQALVTAFRHMIELRERSTSGDERAFDLRLDGQSRGQLVFLRHYTPRIAVGRSDLVVWAGVDLYLAGFAEGRSRRLEIDDEVHAAYSIPGGWCFVCELSVRFFDARSNTWTARWDHDEILVRQRWEGDTLHVEDLNGHVVWFRVADASDLLDPQPAS